MAEVSEAEPKSVDERDREWLANVYRGDKEPDLTVRSVLAGMIFGGLMSLSNLYVGLKSGWGLGVDIAAVIVIFAVFQGLRRSGIVRREFGMMENTMTMTVAVAASWISSAGLVSAVPALTMLTGYEFVWWQLTLFIGVILYLGLFMAIPLKRQMIQVDSLRFPANIPTGETLLVMYSQGGQAIKKAVALALASVMGVLVAGLRDGLGWIPSMFNLPWRLQRISMGRLTLSLEPSLIFVSIGALFGMKVGLSMLLGLIVNYGILAPNLINAKIIKHEPPQIQAAAAPKLPLNVNAGETFTVKLEEAVARPELPTSEELAADPEAASTVDTQKLTYRWDRATSYTDLESLEKDLNAKTMQNGSSNPIHEAMAVIDVVKKGEDIDVLVVKAPTAKYWEARLTLPADQAKTLKSLGFMSAVDIKEAHAKVDEAEAKVAKADVETSLAEASITKADVNVRRAKTRAIVVAAEVEAAIVGAQNARSNSKKAKTDGERALADAAIAEADAEIQKAKAKADAAPAEAEIIIAKAEEARTEAKKAKAEGEQAWSVAEASKAEAEKALTDAEKALAEQNKDSLRTVGGFRNISAWSLWPGATVLVVGGLLALAFQWRTLGRTFASIFSSLGRNAAKGPLDHIEIPMTWFVGGFLLTGGLAVLLLTWIFSIHWWMGVIAVVLTFFLAAVASRAGAEIGINPIGALGKVTQLAYGALAGNITANLMTAGVTAGAACSCSDTIGNLKVGHMVGANPRKQFIAQLFGVLAGALLAVPAYFILVPDAHALGGDKFPAPSALVWMGVAKVLSQGLHTLPPSAIWAMGVAFVLGVTIVVIDQVFPKVKPYTPSPAALGIAMTIPASTSFAMFLGALIAWILEKWTPKWHDMYTIPIASGCIAGESIMGVILAALMALHLIP